MSDNQQLPILRKENVQMIAQSAPDTYNTNQLSTQRCADFGQRLLDEIKRHGMSDDLDKRCAEFIEKAKRTVKAMNERRSPITKLFDQIRSEFTGMENQIDPSKKGTVPFLIQQERNAFATKKREAAERARQEELRKQQREQALKRYQQEAEDDFRRQFDAQITSDINSLTDINQKLSLENYEEASQKLRTFKVQLGKEWFQNIQCHAHKPYEVSDAEAIQIRQSVLNALFQQFCEQYHAEVGDYRDSIVDALPSKKRELERMAKANAEEQERMKKELGAREAAELRRLDEERKRKEDEAKVAKAVQQSANEMDGLFAQNAIAVAAPMEYQPKTSVKKRIVTDTPEGILAIVSMWWSREGQFLPMEELAKIFKKQIAFCEKIANDKNDPELITSPFIRYEEEVKAK